MSPVILEYPNSGSYFVDLTIFFWSLLTSYIATFVLLPIFPDFVSEDYHQIH